VLEFISDSKPLRTVLAPSVCGRRAQPPRREPYAEGGIEPRLEELLADPVTEALMRRDGVNPSSLRELIVRTQKGLRDRVAA